MVIVMIGILIKRATMPDQTITEDQARVIAEEEIKSMNRSNPNYPMVITKSEVRDDGWLFYYTTQKYVETKDDMDIIPGTNPFLVHKNGTTEVIPFPMVRSRYSK